MVAFVVVTSIIGVVALKYGKQVGIEEEVEKSASASEDDQKDSKSEDETQQTEEATDDKPQPTQKVEESTTAKKLIYTNERYPDLSISYDETWSVEVEENDNSDQGAHETKIMFSKQAHQVVFNISSLLGFGSTPVCHVKGTLTYVNLGDR